MEQLEQFKHAIAELHRHESALKKQAREYEALLREIERLRERAERDPDARRKLEKLDETMNSGGRQLQEQIARRAAKLDAVCRHIGGEVNPASPSSDGKLVKGKQSSKTAAPKKAIRSFV